MMGICEGFFDFRIIFVWFLSEIPESFRYHACAICAKI